MSGVRISTAPGQDGDIGRIPNEAWAAAGFRWSTAAHLSPGQVGLWQKRIRDARGTAYFVTVFMWDWREFRARGCPKDWSYEQDDSFERGDDSFRVKRSVTSPESALAFAGEVWSALGCDHYEADASPLPEPPALPHRHGKLEHG